tara:strand:+ start:256 stop:393 length:138 start_codon:yes stop_codon:yes gene_type:complete
MIIEIDFNGSLKAEIEVIDNNIKVLRAVNGYGEIVDVSKVTIKKW